MLSIYDQQSAAAVLGGDLDPTLRALIEGHLTTAKENGLSELTHIAILEPADTEQTMIDELGFTPLVNPISEKRFGQAGFEPAWDWLEVHTAWYEMLYCIGDCGFAVILYVGKNQSAVAQMCSKFANNRAQ